MANYKEEISKVRAELKEAFDSATEGKYTPEAKEKIKGLNTELAGLIDAENLERTKAKNEKAMEQEVYASEEPQAGPSTVGEAFVNSDAYKGYKEDGVKGVDSTVKFSPAYGEKATLGAGLTASFPPEVLRQPGILESALRDPDAVIGLFDQIETNQNSFAYMEETTFTNAAAEQSEQATTAEAELDFTEQTAPIRKVGVFLPVTEELLADVNGIQGYVNSRLGTMMKLRLDNQLLSGDGSAPNMEGVLTKSGINTFDYALPYAGELGKIGQIYQAITEIRKDAFVEPDAIIMHPSDWYDIVTSVTEVDTSGSKNPLFVVAGGFGTDAAPRIWGLPVVASTAISAGTVLVGKFGGGEAAHVVMRSGLDLAVSDSHSDFFLKGKLAIRATMRVGLAVYRQEAFCKITNM